MAALDPVMQAGISLDETSLSGGTKSPSRRSLLKVRRGLPFVCLVLTFNASFTVAITFYHSQWEEGALHL